MHTVVPTLATLTNPPCSQLIRVCSSMRSIRAFAATSANRAFVNQIEKALVRFPLRLGEAHEW